MLWIRYGKHTILIDRRENELTSGILKIHCGFIQAWQLYFLSSYDFLSDILHFFYKKIATFLFKYLDK